MERIIQKIITPCTIPIARLAPILPKIISIGLNGETMSWSNVPSSLSLAIERAETLKIEVDKLNPSMME